MDEVEKGRGAREISRVLSEAERLVYHAGDHAEAVPLVQRLRDLVASFGDEDEAIIVMEARAFLASFDEDLPEEIRHTTRVVELRQHLLDTGYTEPGWAAEDLIDVIEALAALYAEANDSPLVRQWIKEAQRLAQQHGLRFDSEKAMKQLID